MGIFGGRFGTSRYEADEHYRMALQQFQDNDLDKAVQHIDQAIQIAPAQAVYHAARGFFRLEDGLPPTDIEPDFDAALQRNPYEMLANYGKGVLRYREQEYTAAQEYFITAWGAQNDRPETLYYLGMVAHRLRDNVQAVQWMTEAKRQFEAQENDDRAALAQQWIDTFTDLQADE